VRARACVRVPVHVQVRDRRDETVWWSSYSEVPDRLRQVRGGWRRGAWRDGSLPGAVEAEKGASSARAPASANIRQPAGAAVDVRHAYGCLCGDGCAWGDYVWLLMGLEGGWGWSD
jgi:hypothetical protein